MFIKEKIKKTAERKYLKKKDKLKIGRREKIKYKKR